MLWNLRQTRDQGRVGNFRYSERGGFRDFPHLHVMRQIILGSQDRAGGESGGGSKHDADLSSALSRVVWTNAMREFHLLLA